MKSLSTYTVALNWNMLSVEHNRLSLTLATVVLQNYLYSVNFTQVQQLNTFCSAVQLSSVVPGVGPRQITLTAKKTLFCQTLVV